MPVATLLDAGATDLAPLGLSGAARRRLLASAELARRFQPTLPQSQSLEEPRHFLPHLAGLRASPAEVLGVLALDARRILLGELSAVASGSVMRIAVSAREVFAPAIERRAVAIVLAHNHPSGDPDPSPDDRAFTQLMSRAGAILGIQILDHIIVAGGGYFSFAAAHLLSPSPGGR